ncbi:MAG: FG-GAP-like repeat-containing protein [Acidobacteriota bacterium]
MKNFVISVTFLAVVLSASATMFGQKVRLRSQIAPNCTQVRATAGWKFADIFADGNIAVQGSYGCNGAFIYDISNPDSPTLASWYNPGNNQQFLEAIVVGNRGYFGSGIGNGGVHIVDLTDPYQPVLLGVVDSTHGSGHNLIHEMMVFSQDGQTYLLENYNQASSSTKILKFINVTNPAAPVLKWDLSPTDVTWVHAMHIRGNKLYTSGWGGRIEIYDLAGLATQAPRLLGTIQGSSTNHSSWTSEDGNYLFSCRETFDGDLRVYDVRNPAQPLLVRTIKAADLNLNAVTPHNPVVMGNKLYISWYQAGVQVFDITDPTNPRRIGQYDTFTPAFAPTESEVAALRDAGPLDMICGGSNLQNVLPSTYNGDWAVYPFLGENKVLAGDLTSGLLVLDVTAVNTNPKNTVSDFDGDGRTDLSTYTPSTGAWSVEASSTSTTTITSWGLPTDIIAPGDYDGDGKSDRAVYRPSTGMWWILMSSNGTWSGVRFGADGDIPMAADYDADGKADVAVWRPSNGYWYIQQSTLGLRILQWGSSTDKPIVADFEGDGKADPAVFRPSTGGWYIVQSSSSLPIFATFGTNGDKPVSGDFTGDGRADFAVFRPSTGIWYILDGATQAFTGIRFGTDEDIPVAADFDGDGKSDIAVFRPSTNYWYRLNSSDGSFFARGFGQDGDRPSPSSINPQ